MSDNLKIKLLTIADNLSQVHKHDYTANRIIATYWEVYDLFEKTQDGLDNRDSSILSDSLLSNEEQK
ncbi:hypothetical protein [Yeosuana marina]|uniref:hypothetical protein n=1 Tax=Yeosuana marina TaxID=1565536 RepID=UPI0030ECA627|tara:strand:+ start:1561 stop:1761 length:201 start_codon:yes stop_codon:yes gene_type:complete